MSKTTMQIVEIFLQILVWTVPLVENLMVNGIKGHMDGISHHGHLSLKKLLTETCLTKECGLDLAMRFW